MNRAFAGQGLFCAFQSGQRCRHLPGDAVQVEGEQQGAAAQACARQGGLAARMPRAHHHHVVAVLCIPAAAQSCCPRAGPGASAAAAALPQGVASRRMPPLQQTQDISLCRGCHCITIPPLWLNCWRGFQSFGALFCTMPFASVSAAQKPTPLQVQVCLYSCNL